MCMYSCIIWTVRSVAPDSVETTMRGQDTNTQKAPDIRGHRVWRICSRKCPTYITCSISHMCSHSMLTAQYVKMNGGGDYANHLGEMQRHQQPTSTQLGNGETSSMPCTVLLRNTHTPLSRGHTTHTPSNILRSKNN